MLAETRKSKPVIPTNRENSNCIGGRLRDLRLHNRLKLREMAEIIGVVPDTYRSYEDSRREIRGESLRLIVKALNVDSHWLLTGEIKPGK